MSRYDASNVAERTRVYDVDTMQEIKQVVHIDTDGGYIEYHPMPLEVVGNQFVRTESIRYCAIHPIFGGSHVPVMFHCYGKIE